MDLAITSLGMVTAVGHDVVTACAAMRAGINRFHEMDYFEALDLETQSTKPVIGCAIHGYAEGFVLVGFWIRLALGCLEDLIKNGRLPDKTDTLFWSKTGLIGVTPVINDERLDVDEACTPNDAKEAYLKQLFEVFKYPIHKENTDIICHGHGGTIAAISRAQDMLKDKKLERAIILAVDTYVDAASLEWLEEHNRLKDDNNPVGLTPGEAGACFMLETFESSRKRGAPVQAIVKKPALARENNHYYSAARNQGEALAAVVGEALKNASTPIPFDGDVISDLNGEEWRAYEFGMALVRMEGKLSPMLNMILPCESIGEIGAASGAVAVCIGARALQRGYARQDSVLIVSSSDLGQVGAVCLSSN
jgi:3-oxoacyl-[acyl-carrier-protein] synthase-1